MTPTPIGAKVTPVMRYTLFEVGGKVRDELLGLESDDVDFSVVIEGREGDEPSEVLQEFEEQLVSEGYSVFLVTASCFTIRAKFPADHKYEGVADFVLARKELGYVEGTRKPIVVLGTLYDDLVRRDFTVNAMARGEDGELIDLFGGAEDLKLGILNTPKAAYLSFADDPLRILRAFRFEVTKGFFCALWVNDAIRYFSVDKMKVVSTERIQAEFRKMFKHDTFESLRVLEELRELNEGLYRELLGRGFWFEPTSKKR